MLFYEILAWGGTNKTKIKTVQDFIYTYSVK